MFELVGTVPDIYEHDELTTLVHENRHTAERIVKTEFGNGIRVYYENHPHPYKSYPTIPAINAINITKRLFLAWPRLSLSKIEEIGMIALKPHLLKPQYMTPIARELRHMIPTTIGLLISHVIEYDSAYRLRLQDLMSETTQAALTLFPEQELKRLQEINNQRDYRAVHKKVKKIITIVRLALLYPPFKRKWQQALKTCTFKNLQLDQADAYWLAQRIDYGPTRTNP